MVFARSGFQGFCGFLLITFLVAGRSHADVKVETIDYRGWKGSYRVTNGTVELVFVPQIGRVMRYGFVGGKNVLWENPALFGKAVDQKNPGTEWVNFGGDKLWPAPQSRWNWPPNPVLDAGDHDVISVPGGRLLVRGEPSEKDGIKFSRMIVMARSGTEVKFFNSMTNVKRAGDVNWSVWEVAQVDDPESAVMPVDPRNPVKGFYGYKDNPPAESQIRKVGRIIRFTRGKEKGAKIGAASSEGWLASEKGRIRFRVWAKHPLAGTYPHDGNAQEIWSNPDPLKYMELELLSPMVTLKPGKTYTFETRWELENIEGRHACLPILPVKNLTLAGGSRNISPRNPSNRSAINQTAWRCDADIRRERGCLPSTPSVAAQLLRSSRRALMYPETRSNAAVLERPVNQMWDYEVRSIHARHDSNLQDELKKYGRDGWELVHVNIPMGNEYHCIFRKPLP